MNFLQYLWDKKEMVVFNLSLNILFWNFGLFKYEIMILFGFLIYITLQALMYATERRRGYFDESHS